MGLWGLCREGRSDEELRSEGILFAKSLVSDSASVDHGQSLS
jgi:hypothetical protein